MAWIFVATSAIIILNVLAAPVPKFDTNSSVINSLEQDADKSSVNDPLLVPKTSQKFADIFKYALEICRSFSPHQEIELKKGILMMTDALEDFPETKDMDRMVLEATAATIARNVVEFATKDGGIFDKMSCVEQALKRAFQLTTRKPDHYFISEVQRMIELFYLQVQPLQSYERSYSGYYDSFGDYEVYSEAPDFDDVYEPDDYEYPDKMEYFEFPGEMEYYEDMEPYLEDDFQSDEYEPYYEMEGLPFMEEPKMFEYEIMEIPVDFY